MKVYCPICNWEGDVPDPNYIQCPQCGRRELLEVPMDEEDSDDQSIYP